MTCAGTETQAIALFTTSESWYTIGQGFGYGPVLMQLVRGCNWVRNKIGLSDISVPLLGVVEDDDSLTGFLDTDNPTYNVVRLAREIMKTVCEGIYAAAFASQIVSCKSWHYLNEELPSATGLSQTNGTYTVTTDRSKWFTIIVAIRDSIETFDEQEFNGWTSHYLLPVVVDSFGTRIANNAIKQVLAADSFYGSWDYIPAGGGDRFARWAMSCSPSGSRNGYPGDGFTVGVYGESGVPEFAVDILPSGADFWVGHGFIDGPYLDANYNTAYLPGGSYVAWGGTGTASPQHYGPRFYYEDSGAYNLTPETGIEAFAESGWFSQTTTTKRFYIYLSLDGTATFPPGSLNAGDVVQATWSCSLGTIDGYASLSSCALGSTSGTVQWTNGSSATQTVDVAGSMISSGLTSGSFAMDDAGTSYLIPSITATKFTMSITSGTVNVCLDNCGKYRVDS